VTYDLAMQPDLTEWEQHRILFSHTRMRRRRETTINHNMQYVSLATVTCIKFWMAVCDKHKTGLFCLLIGVPWKIMFSPERNPPVIQISISKFLVPYEAIFDMENHL
jgi:hypothetical protein